MFSYGIIYGPYWPTSSCSSDNNKTLGVLPDRGRILASFCCLLILNMIILRSFTGPTYFYASGFRPRKHYVLRLSVHLKSLKYHFSTYTWVHWSIWLSPLQTDRLKDIHGQSDWPWPFFSLSVWRGFWAFHRKRMQGMACNLACWYILTTFRSG